MFWRFGGYANISTLDSILDKPDVTLEELLDESDLIQELKQHNTKLVEFLRDEKVLRKLLEYVIAPKPAPAEPQQQTSEPSSSSAESSESKKPGSEEKASHEPKHEDSMAAAPTLLQQQRLSNEDREKEEKQRLKYAFVACEVLSSEAWSIVESLMMNPEHLRMFWRFLERPPPLDPLQASYFTKVNETLLDKKTEEMMAFIKSVDGVVENVLKHVDCPMIMDLLLKIISMEKCEGGAGIVDWLHDQNLIPLLLSFLSDKYPASTQTASGDFIKALITISANASQNEQSCIGPNDLTRQLVSEECIRKLIDDMLKGGNPLTVGVGIIIEVIRKNNSDYDPEIGNGPDSAPTSKDPIYLGTLLRLFASHVPQFMELIQKHGATTTSADGTRREIRKELKVAFGGAIEPLGFDRFKTCELMAELLHCSNMGLLNEKGGERYVKERDRERERLKQERRKQQQNMRLDEDDDDEGHTADNEGVVVDKPQLHVQNGEADVSDDGMNEDEYEDVTISALLDEPSVTGGEGKEGAKKEEGKNEFVDEPLSTTSKEPALPGASLVNDPVPAPIPADEIPPLNIKPKGPVQKEIVEKLDEIAAAKAKAKASEEDVEMEDVPPPPPPKDDPPASTPAKSDKAEDPEVPRAPSPPPAAEDDDEKLRQDGRSLVKDLKASVPEQAVVSPERMDAELPPLPAEPQDEEENLMDLSESEHHEGDVSVRSLGSFESSFTEYQTLMQPDVDGNPVVGDYLKMMFVEHQVVPTILDFFFRFPWNNFLHNVVYDVVQQVFNGPMDRGYNRALAIDLFVTGQIIERIIGGQKTSEKFEKERKMRLGYMGHLTLVAEEVVKFSERHPPEVLGQKVLDKISNPSWIEYVEETLAATRERDNAILGGVRPDMHLGPRIAGIGAAQMQAFNANSGGASTGLDSIDLANATSATGSSGSSTAGLLSSGFGSSSDEEDDEMEHDEEEDEVARLGLSGSSDQFASYISQEITNVDKFASSDEDDDDEDDSDEDDDNTTTNFSSGRYDGAAPSDPPPPPPPLPLNIRRAQKREEKEKEREREKEREKARRENEEGAGAEGEQPSAIDEDEDMEELAPLRRRESHESDPPLARTTQSSHRDPLDDDFEDDDEGKREIERLLAGKLEGLVISAKDFYGGESSGEKEEGKEGEKEEKKGEESTAPQPREVTVKEMEIDPEAAGGKEGKEASA